MIRATHLTSGKGGKGSPAAVAKYARNERDQEKAVGYYEHGAQSEWLGRGAEIAGLRGEVQQEDMIRVLSGIAPDGTDISRRGGQSQESRRFGEELTVSAPKSVSIMSVEDRRIVAAHQAAVRDAIAYVEKEMVYARRGKGGIEAEFTGNIIAGRYTHEDSRPDSITGMIAPHLHDHVIFANMTQREDGQWVALKLDWGHENEKKMVADAIYKAALAKYLMDLGYEIEWGKGNDFEIKGITREQIEHFSPRSEAIKAEIGGERSGVSAKEREAAQNRTRVKKRELSATEQRFEWRQELRDAGVPAGALREAAEARAAAGDRREAITPEQAIQSAVRHLSERDTTFSKDQLRQAALAAGMGSVRIEDIDKAIEARAAGLIDAGAAKGLRSQAYTTEAASLREAEILARAREGKGQAEAIIGKVSKASDKEELPSFTKEELSHDRRTAVAVPYVEKAEPLTGHLLQGLSQRHLDAEPKRADRGVLPGNEGSDRSRDGTLRRHDDRPEPASGAVAAIIREREASQGFAFSQGQRAAVELALTTQDRHIGIVGAAGAGKTTSMALIVEQYKAAGYEVVGVAPSAAAAKELESAGCDKTQTLASSLLEKRDPDDKKPRLYVLDEAGMVSAKDYDKFFRKADVEGARTLSVGDPRQLQSVEAGTAFKQLLETGSVEHVRIDEIQRQKDPKLREIATAFAQGDAERGVELAKPYMRQVEKGKLVDTAADAYLSLSQEEREKTLLLVGTNKTRQEINEKVREGLVKERTLGEQSVTVTAFDKLDLTKEQITKAANFHDDEKQVVVSIREKGEDGKSRPVYYDVVDTSNGKLTLRDRENPNQPGVTVDPAKARIEGVFIERQIELRDGEKVMFRQNDKERGITNGDLGTVHIGSDGKAWAETKGGIVELNDKPQVLDYAYARTIHSSQGATVERAIVVGESNRVSTAEAAYVACSREKTGLEIITENKDKLGNVWSKFSERQAALDAQQKSQRAELDVPRSLAEIQAARQDAERKLEQPEKQPARAEPRPERQDVQRQRQDEQEIER